MKRSAAVILCIFISTVSIAQKKFRTLEGALLNPTEATELILSGSQDYKNLSPDIAKLTNLKILKLYGCGITKLTSAIGELKNLEVLDLGGNYLKILPPEICKLTKLRELSLQRNGLAELPDEIGNMVSLGQLDLSNNKLTSLPLSLYMLHYLFYLDLQFNELAYLSPQISMLTNLEVLDLSRNKLDNIPDKLWFTPKLYSLNLYKCGAMLSFPKDICNIPSSSIKPRGANIDSWHMQSGMVLPKCPFGNDGVRNGWYINVTD